MKKLKIKKKIRRVASNLKKDKNNLRTKFFIIGLIIISFSTLYLAYYYKNNPQATKLYKVAGYTQVGQINDCQNSAMGVIGLRDDKVGIPDFWPAGNGKKFVMVKMYYLNKSNDIYHFSPVYSAKLFDSQGVAYEVSSAPNIEEALGGPIGAWQSVVGEIGFFVPENDNNFRFEFTSNSSNPCNISTNLQVAT